MKTNVANAFVRGKYIPLIMFPTMNKKSISSPPIISLSSVLNNTQETERMMVIENVPRLKW